MPSFISVIICTYNRGDILSECLRSLTNQSIPSEYFEVIIINNNSTDNTQKIAESFVYQASNYRVIIEHEQGISAARNRGWKEAKGEYIAYTDDDCRLPPDWLKKALEIIENHSPDLFGGPYHAAYLSQKPPWFKDSYGSLFIASDPKYLSRGEYLSAGNLFIKKEILAGLDGFNHKLGPTGYSIKYGEETAIQEILYKSMPDVRIYYDPDLFVSHLVRPEKFKLSDFLRRGIASSRDGQEIFESEPEKLFPQFIAIIKNCAFITLAARFFLGGGLFRNQEAFPFYENYLIEVIFPHLYCTGQLKTRLKKLFKNFKN